MGRLSFLYSVFILFLFWIAVSSLKTFVRLLGQERLIVIDDQSVTLPEYGDSLNAIRLSFAQIRDIYFAEGRHGLPDNLIIKYDLDGHAYIQRDALDGDDFDEICELFKLHLRVDEIETK